MTRTPDPHTDLADRTDHLLARFRHYSLVGARAHLDIETGLREITSASHHAVVCANASSRIDIEAGLQAITRNHPAPSAPSTAQQLRISPVGDTGDATAHAEGAASSSALNEPVIVNPETRSRQSMAVLTVSLLILGFVVAGAMRWSQASLVWLTIIVATAVVLINVPLAWVWSPRRDTGRPAEVLLAAAMVMSLIGAAFIGGGVSAMRDHDSAMPNIDSAMPIIEWMVSDHVRAYWTDITPSDGSAQRAGVLLGSARSGVGTPTSVPPVRRRGTFTLGSGYQVDLDSTAPTWGIVVSEDTWDGNYESDLAVRRGQILAVHGAWFARTTSIRYDTCRAATNFGGSIRADEVAAGKTMACLRTGRNRVAALQVMNVTRRNGFLDEVQLSVTVW